MPTLEDLIETFCAELRRGVTPSIEAYAKAHPEYADDLRRLLPALLTMEDFTQAETGLPQAMELPLPMMLGTEFRLECEIGRGGMGTVFEAVQVPLDRRCAVKVLARNLAADPQHRAAFIREARVIGHLHHPHVVKVFSAGETPDYAYYAMELVGTSSLDRKAPTGAKQLASWALQAAVALAYAHRCGVTHCDIKPSNLLLDAEGHLLISDFGLARLGSASSTTEAPSCTGGTKAYLAPECREHNTFTPRSDQYAFGITFLELAEHLDTLPPDLKAIFTVCTTSDAEDRYADMDDVASDLRHFLADEPVSVRPARLRRKVALWARRHPLAAASALILTIGLPVFTTLLALSHQKTLQALAAAEHNLAVADNALACTFEHIGKYESSRRAAMLLDVLMPYYRDILIRSDAPLTRLAEAEAVIAAIAYRTGDYATAVAAYQRRYEADPTPTAANQLADALRLAGDTEAARALYRQTAATTPTATSQQEIESLRARCALSELEQTPPDEALLSALQAACAADPENPTLRHLSLSAAARIPNTNNQTDLDAQRLALAAAFPTEPTYGIAALTRITARLDDPTPLTEQEEALLESARKTTQQLLGLWPDDPQILLAAVRFSAADSRRLRTNPRLKQQARRAAERLSGALEVLFCGSSLPEDTRDPLFNTLFSSLMESRREAERKQAARFRRMMNEQVPRRPRPNPWYTRGRNRPNPTQKD